MVDRGVTLAEIARVDMNIDVSFPPDALRSLSKEEIFNRIVTAKRELSGSLFILGHHYQRDEVFNFADSTGDSFLLSKTAAKSDAKLIVFCGVHFMAETADIVSSREQKVFLPNIEAGCSLADMADIEQVDSAFTKLNEITGERHIPITYINSKVSLKAFCGRNGGIVCTSSNAQRALEWAWEQGERVIFFPDQHLGRNSAHKMGVSPDRIITWDSTKPLGGNSEESVRQSKLVLWEGFCDVHMQFFREGIDALRERYPDIKIIVHPECRFNVAQSADYMGSTEQIIRAVKDSPSGSKWAVGTESHMVDRLAKQCSDKLVISLSKEPVFCPTMSIIEPVHLMYQLENLAKGNLINRVVVEETLKSDALTAINRMLEL